MTDRELMKQVMENICGAKLCEINSMSSRQEMLRLLDKAIDALGDRLAQPEQAHTGFMDSKLNPIKRPWVGLTDEEINSIPDCEYMDFYKAINAKLKEKNT
jgi:hypothetical protein